MRQEELSRRRRSGRAKGKVVVLEEEKAQDTWLMERVARLSGGADAHGVSLRMIAGLKRARCEDRGDALVPQASMDQEFRRMRREGIAWRAAGRGPECLRDGAGKLLMASLGDSEAYMALRGLLETARRQGERKGVPASVASAVRASKVQSVLGRGGRVLLELQSEAVLMQVAQVLAHDRAVMAALREMLGEPGRRGYQLVGMQEIVAKYSRMQVRAEGTAVPPQDWHVDCSERGRFAQLALDCGGGEIGTWVDPSKRAGAGKSTMGKEEEATAGPQQITARMALFDLNLLHRGSARKWEHMGQAAGHVVVGNFGYITGRVFVEVGAANVTADAMAAQRKGSHYKLTATVRFGGAG